MTLSWESEKLARTWCHCDGDFCTWKQSLAALRRANESAGYLFPVDPVCHNPKSRLEGEIDGSPSAGHCPLQQTIQIRRLFVTRPAMRTEQLTQPDVGCSAIRVLYFQSMPKK